MDPETNETLQRILAKAQVVPNAPRLCPLPDWLLAAEHKPGDQACDGERHYRYDADGREHRNGDCPAIASKRVEPRIEAERKRLAGALERLDRGGGQGFAGYDTDRHPSALKALTAMRTFSQGRPPTQNVLLVGSTGLGKTRLLLASHFALLAAGANSHYVTSPELRDWFRRSGSFDEDAKHEADHVLDRLRGADVIHADDLGDVEGDRRFKGMFAEGLKGLLDRSRAAWAVSTNLTYAEAEQHPDIGGKILSRLLENATLIKMDGADYRTRRFVK